MRTTQIVVRVPLPLADALDRAARRAGRRRSDLVRAALEHYLRPGKVRGAAAVEHLIGSLESGVPDLATEHRRHVLASLERGR